MKKQILKNMQFGIRTIKKGTDGQLIPVVKIKGLFSEWVPIIKIYPNDYILFSYEAKGLTLEDCYDHINGFKKQQELEELNAAISVTTQIVNL